MDRNQAYWIGMIVSGMLIGFAVNDRSWLEFGIGAGLIAFVNVYGYVAAKLEKRKVK